MRVQALTCTVTQHHAEIINAEHQLLSNKERLSLKALQSVVAIIFPFVHSSPVCPQCQTLWSFTVLTLFVCVCVESACALLRRFGIFHAIGTEGSRILEREVPPCRWRQSHLWFIQVSANISVLGH